MFKTVALIIFLAGGCATKPTPYQREKNHEGFHDQTLDGLRSARFSANSATKKSRALIYAEFRAIQRCRSENKLASIIDVFDRSAQKDFTRTSGGGWGPSYGFGMSPYYGRYSSFGFGIGYNSMSSDSWREAMVLPVYEVIYTCAEKVWSPGLILHELNPDEMKVLAKDLKGAIQIDQLEEYSVNKSIVEQNDIILKANGRRIEHVYEFVRLFNAAGAKIIVDIFREGERRTVTLGASEVTDQAEKLEQDIIQKVCRDRLQSHQKTLKKICQ